MFAAVPWHYWIGVVIAISAIGMLLATVAGYFFSVSRTRYPSKRR